MKHSKLTGHAARARHLFNFFGLSGPCCPRFVCTVVMLLSAAFAAPVQAQYCPEWQVQTSGDQPWFIKQSQACSAYVAYINSTSGIVNCPPLKGPVTFTLISTEGYCRVGLSSVCHIYHETNHAYNSRLTLDCPLIITISGASSTKALPAGPALMQIVRVTQGGAPVKNRAVGVSITSGGTVGGSTNDDGEFRFTYVPPRRRTIDSLKATCEGCDDPARKQIFVEQCDVCEQGGAQ